MALADILDKLPIPGRAKGEDDEERRLLSSRDFRDYPHLLAAKPRSEYVFASDYFAIDGNSVGCVLAFFHHNIVDDNFLPFWGINYIPRIDNANVSTINFEQIRRMTKQWVDDHQSKAENISQQNMNEAANGGGTVTSRQKASKSKSDIETIARELGQGASYLHVQNRLLVKAPTIDELDRAMNEIAKRYVELFGTVEAHPYLGDQRKELSDLFSKNDRKNGKGFHYTSTEYAGAYSLVTHGLEDKAGEYVGAMIGDVNNSAVIFDVDNYRKRVVVANEELSEDRDDAFVSDMWGSKISQAALMGNHRVVHIILDGARLDDLGPKFKNITSVIDMNKGDVNMFELFGDVEDELSIFPQHMQKLVLMAEQAYETTDSDRSIIRGELKDVATQFYVDKRMWYYNAPQNRDKLRVVGVPHKQVPRLQDFVMYLDQRYKAAIQSDARDERVINAAKILQLTFRDLLDNNGDLFNTYTDPAIDDAVNGLRVIYDFSQLRRRGEGIAMAQLVNVIGFAVNNLSAGDVVIIHGAEYIEPGVREYVTRQLENILVKRGRVVYLYNHMDKMLEDIEFNQFDKADYTVLGNMTQNTVDKYQETLGTQIPVDLANLIVNKKAWDFCYIRRGFDNVVFQQDLILEYNPNDRYVKA